MTHSVLPLSSHQSNAWSSHVEEYGQENGLPLSPFLWEMVFHWRSKIAAHLSLPFTAPSCKGWISGEPKDRRSLFSISVPLIGHTLHPSLTSREHRGPHHPCSSLLIGQRLWVWKRQIQRTRGHFCSSSRVSPREVSYDAFAQRFTAGAQTLCQSIHKNAKISTEENDFNSMGKFHHNGVLKPMEILVVSN